MAKRGCGSGTRTGLDRASTRGDRRRCGACMRLLVSPIHRVPFPALNASRHGPPLLVAAQSRWVPRLPVMPSVSAFPARPGLPPQQGRALPTGIVVSATREPSVRPALPWRLARGGISGRRPDAGPRPSAPGSVRRPSLSPPCRGNTRPALSGSAPPASPTRLRSRWPPSRGPSRCTPRPTAISTPQARRAASRPRPRCPARPGPRSLVGPQPRCQQHQLVRRQPHHRPAVRPRRLLTPLPCPARRI